MLNWNFQILDITIITANVVAVAVVAADGADAADTVIAADGADAVSTAQVLTLQAVLKMMTKSNNIKIIC